MASTRVNGMQTVVLYVDDVARSTEFYGGLLGLPVVWRDAEVAAYEVGGTRILLHPSDGRPRPRRDGWRVEIYLGVDDVDEAVAGLRRAGVPVLEEPTDQPWGERDAAVADPDGYPVHLTRSLDDSWLKPA